MGGLTATERYFAAHCAMLFATAIADLVVVFGLLWLARRRRDPARRCLTLVKFAAGFYLIFCLVDFCADAVWIAFSRLSRAANEGDYDNLGILTTLLQAKVELSAASRFIDCLVVIFVFLVNVYLGVGVNIVRGGGPAAMDGIIKRVSYVFAAVLAVMASVGWGLRIRVYLEYYTDRSYEDLIREATTSLPLLNVAQQLDFAFVVIAWALSISVMVRSTQIWMPSRNGKRLGFPILYLVLCSCAWLLRETYELVYQAKFVNIKDIRRSPKEPGFMQIIDAIFHVWIIFVVICLVLALGVRTDRGLWSTEQTCPMYNSDGSQNVRLESRHSSPPAYSPPSQTASPSTQNATQPTTTGTNSPRAQPPPNAQLPRMQQRWQQPFGGVHEDVESHDRGLVENLGPHQRYQPPGVDDAYNAGFLSSGPTDRYGFSIPSQPPPPHDEAMGLNYQADGIAPQTEPLPYPEKN